MLIIKKTACRSVGNILYYILNFPYSLKELLKNKAWFLKVSNSKNSVLWIVNIRSPSPVSSLDKSINYSFFGGAWWWTVRASYTLLVQQDFGNRASGQITHIWFQLVKLFFFLFCAKMKKLMLVGNTLTGLDSSGIQFPNDW